jgi:integrase
MKPRGRHPDKALSVKAINALRMPGRYADGGGLYLEVDPSGAKRWVLRITVGGRRRDIGLGGLRDVSLAEARDKTTDYRRVARTGGDPVAEKRKAARAVPTFETAATLVHQEHAPGWRNPKHAAQWINTLREYAFPIIGSRAVDQIDTPDVLKVLAPIWLTKPETARRVRQRLRTVFDWAKAAGHRSGDNPADTVIRGLPRQADRAAHHAALPYAEVSAFVGSLTDTGIGEIARLAFEFLILTATRTSETLGARRSELDLEQKVWTIPAERMKASKEHRVPLSPRAVEILERALEVSADSEFVFASNRAGRHLSNMVFLMTLRRMGLTTTAHGFRSAFRDWASERTNFPREVSEAALAHTVRDKTEAAYARSDLFAKRRQLMEAWAAFVTAAPGKVVTLAGARLA